MKPTHAIWLATLPLALGGSATTPLQGNGVPGCRPVIVHCNYGALYNGTVSWSSTLNYIASSANQTRRSDRSVSVTATIANGTAICAGTVTENRSASGDETERGWLRATIGGPGLFAVEFDKDAQGKLYYLVTIACPSESGTDSTENLKTGQKDGNAITVTLPELDGREMQSDKQPATRPGMNLNGSITFRHPDEDPLNGVNGTVTVSWALNAGGRPPP
jgi:hypothetical protein